MRGVLGARAEECDGKTPSIGARFKIEAGTVVRRGKVERARKT